MKSYPTIFSEIEKFDCVGYTNNWVDLPGAGFYIETNTTKNSKAEEVLDKLVELVGEEDVPKFHFGLKTYGKMIKKYRGPETLNKDDCYVVYGVPMDHYKTELAARTK